MKRVFILFLLFIFVVTVSCTSVATMPPVAPDQGEEEVSGIASPYRPFLSSEELPFVESFGKTIMVINQSGFSFEHLSFETKPAIEIGEATNLLGKQDFPSGSMISLPVSELPWLSEELVFDAYGRVYITALSQEGKKYSLVWYPTSDLWTIVLGVAL